ncbi:MAG: signal peptidase I [Sphingosinicella sp.]
MSDEPLADAPEPPAEKKESWWETIRFFLLLFLAAVAIRSLLFAPFSIPSGSMLPNLMIGDYLFVAKWPYGFSRFSFPFGIARFGGRVFERLPERGDVVVFRFPGDGDSEDFVKRVIGLPGDTIAIRDGAIVLNGAVVRRQRIADYAMPMSPNSPCRIVGNDPDAGERGDAPGTCFYPRYRETLPGGRSYEVLDQGETILDNRAPIVVPDGQLFVMGDNRDDSADSRVPPPARGIGLLPAENLLGRASMAFWSTDGSAEWLLPWTWLSAARWQRIGQTW